MITEVVRRAVGAKHDVGLPAALAIILSYAIAAFALADTGIGVGLEREIHGLRDLIRSRPATGQIVLAEIDARSLAEINHWPWPRGIHAQAVKALDAAGASLVAFDVEFSAHSSRSEDAKLARAIRQSHAQIALPTFRQPVAQGSSRLVENLPIPELREEALLASVNIFADSDGLVRSYPYGVVTGGSARPSIGAILASAHGRTSGIFPIDGAIEPATIPRISFVDLINGKVKPNSLTNRMVVVGATAIEMGDRYPVQRYGVIPGAVIQILAAETLVQGSSPVTFGTVVPIFIGLFAIVLLARRSGRSRAIGMSIVGLLLLALPLAMEAAKAGSVEVVPALGGLTVAAALCLVEAALRASRRAQLFDVDTGLPNRRSMQIDHPAPTGSVWALRLDSYSDAVGVLGNAYAADAVVRISERIAVAVSSRVYRVEDNALAWLVEPLEHGEERDRIEGTVALLRSPVEVGGRAFDLGAVLGIARTGNAELSELVGKSLLAADRAHELGQPWAIHSEDLDRERDWRFSLPHELDKALSRRDIWVAYQPKYDLRAHRVSGAEALVRWEHPERGSISPDAFIPVLEESGRIVELTLFVLRQALEDMAGWRATGYDLSVAVNVSAKLPSDPNFMRSVKALIEEFQPDRETLTLEVTESVAMSDLEVAIPALAHFKELGIRLSIDDYGTGQSTLSYLKTLPASEIKIDKGFVTALESNKSDQAMVRSTIDLAHELGYRVVVEGVETKEICDILASFDCDVVQGWYIGRPMKNCQFIQLVESRAAQAA